MTSSNYEKMAFADRMYLENKRIMEEAAAYAEMEAMMKREPIVPQLSSGNRAERRKQAALGRKK